MSSRREQNRTEQRERILDAARQLFAERGFDPVTMAAIARQAGVARATVFNYFPSKHNLVESITEDVFAYFRAMLEAALADEATPTPTLVRACFAHMGAGIEQAHDFYSEVFREIVKIQVGLDEGSAAARMRDAALALLVALMERGQRRGELRRQATPEDLAHAFNSLSNGTIVRWLFDDDSGSLRDHMLRAAEIFLGAVAEAGEHRASEPVPELFSLPFSPSGPLREPGDARRSAKEAT